MRKLVLALALLLPPAVVAGSCALHGFDDGPAATATATTTGSGQGGNAGGGGAGGASCEHLFFPDPPADGTEGGDIEFVVAIRSIWLSEDAGQGGSSAQPVGRDLDELCTCQGQESSCVAPGNDCDGPGGTDNGVAGLFELLGTALGEADLADFYSQRANNGEWSLLLRVRDYNGEADDSQIRVALYVPNGLPMPQWNGTDPWPVADTSLDLSVDAGAPLDHPRYEDRLAYVTNNVFVATVPQSEIIMTGGTSRLTLRLTAGGIMGTIVQVAGGWKITQGIIAARLRAPDLFVALSSFRYPNGLPLCTNDLFYPAAKLYLCDTLDILGQLGPPSRPCDAVSLGIAFEADPALLGPVVQAAPQTAGCDPPDIDPANDSCD